MPTGAAGAVKYRWVPPDGVRTVNVASGQGWPCSSQRRASSSAPASWPLSLPCPAFAWPGTSGSRTTRPEGPQAMPMFHGFLLHQVLMRAGSVVARSCQLPLSPGRLAPGAHGKTCQPRAAAARAASRRDPPGPSAGSGDPGDVPAIHWRSSRDSAEARQASGTYRVGLGTRRPVGKPSMLARFLSRW